MFNLNQEAIYYDDSIAKVLEISIILKLFLNKLNAYVGFQVEVCGTYIGGTQRCSINSKCHY